MLSIVQVTFWLIVLYCGISFCFIIRWYIYVVDDSLGWYCTLNCSTLYVCCLVRTHPYIPHHQYLQYSSGPYDQDTCRRDLKGNGHHIWCMLPKGLLYYIVEYLCRKLLCLMVLYSKLTNFVYPYDSWITMGSQGEPTLCMCIVINWLIVLDCRIFIA